MKNLKNVLYALVFVLLASSVCAASFNMNDLEFGSTTQAPGADVTQTLHVVNDGLDPLTITLASSMPSTYNARLSQSTLTLAAGASTDVTVTVFIPTTQPSGRNEVSGGIVATSNVTGLTKTARTYVSIEKMLEISKVTVELNGDGEERTLRRDATYNNDIKAGTPITVTVYVRNNFDSIQDIEIRDIEVDIRSSGDIDLDESDSMSDLGYGDKDSISFSSEIPTDAEDGDNYNIDVTVRGIDENGVAHSDTYHTELEVVKESHEITIKSFSLSPQSISCGGKVTVNAELKNTGSHNEDKVHFLIEDNDLGLSQRFYSMTLDEDDTIKKTYSFNVDNKTAPGQYDIILTSFYNSDTESDVQVLSLIVNPCQVTTTTTTPITTTTINPGAVTPPIPPVVPTYGATPVYGSASFTDSPEYLIILVAAVVIILAILIILLAKFIF
jgi:hypothetical protein